MKKIRIKTILLSLSCAMSPVVYGQMDSIQPAPFRNIEKVLSTASVSTVGGDLLTKTITSTFDNSLVGNLNGLTMNRNNGSEPGWESFQYYIRGASTFGASSAPLVIVDDIERSTDNLSLLTAEEVESVSILKDAAATAIYGNRAANGVILVKTKRGLISKPQVTLKTTVGLQHPNRLPQYLGSADYVRYRNIAMQHDGLPVPSTGKYNPDNYAGGLDPYTYANTDWYGTFLNSVAPQQNYQLSIRGGDKNVLYYVYFGALVQDGLYNYTRENKGYSTNSRYTTYNLRSNVDVPVNERLKISIDLSSRMEIKHSSGASASDIFSSLSSLPPTMPVFNRNGSLAGLSDHQKNPYGMIASSGLKQRYIRDITAVAKLDYELSYLLKGLYINGMIAFDSYKEYGRSKSQSYATFEETADGSYIQYGTASDLNLNYAKYADDYYLRTSFNGGISYRNRFGAHGILADARAVYSIHKVTGNNADYRRANYYIKSTYDYDKRYVADVTLAYSGSEDFIGKNRYQLFPVGSVAWVLSNEDFFSSNAFTLAKLRASYGMVGNADLGIVRFPYLISFGNTGGYIFGDGFATSDGAYESRITNANIGAEKAYIANVGIDMELYKQLAVTVDYFRQNRQGIITTRDNTIPLAVGQVLPYENIGSVLSQGFETEVKYAGKAGQLNYFTRLNLSFARNIITDCDEVAGQESWLYKKGHSVNQAWGLEAQGLFRDQNEIASYPVSTYGVVKPGDVKYKNQNADDLIDSNDMVPLGKPTLPEWNTSLQLGASYRGFDFFVTLAGVFGRSLFVNNSAIFGMYEGNNITSNVQYAWQQGVNEESAIYPRLSTLYNQHNMQQSSLWLMDGSYVKVQNIELGYTFPSRWLQKASIKELRLYLNGYNIASFDRLRQYGLSAEVPSTGISSYPITATYSFGLTVKF